MKNILSRFLILLIVSSFFLTACGQKEVKTLKVGATPVPHVDLLRFAQSKLEEKGIQLEIVEFSDYVAPNLSLKDGTTDANLFQHEPYMKNFAGEYDIDLVALGRVNLNPMGLYSNRIDTLSELQRNYTLALPNDPINEARALLFLEVNGLLTLQEGIGLKADTKDVVDNPYNFKFKPVEAAQLPRVLNDVDLAVITGNYALGAGISPLEEALVLEDTRSKFPNVLATTKALKDDVRLQALLDILQSDDMVKFMKKEYKGAVVPGFEVN